MGSTIVVTASLAGLVGIPDDPIYGLTKHAVVGFVRSVAPAAREAGNPDPGRLPRLGRHCPDAAGVQAGSPRKGFRLLQPSDVAEGVWAAYKSEGTGEAWIVQPGREPLLYEFKGVPGPR